MSIAESMANTACQSSVTEVGCTDDSQVWSDSAACANASCSLYSMSKLCTRLHSMRGRRYRSVDCGAQHTHAAADQPARLPSAGQQTIQVLAPAAAHMCPLCPLSAELHLGTASIPSQPSTYHTSRSKCSTSLPGAEQASILHGSEAMRVTCLTGSS